MDRGEIVWIYFIRSGDSGPIKIGHSRESVETRIGDLQTGNPENLTLLFAVRAPDRTEKQLHRIFKDFKIRGEWFEPQPELLSFIDQLREREWERSPDAKISQSELPPSLGLLAPRELYKGSSLKSSFRSSAGGVGWRLKNLP